jgi:hypothetical protein
VATSCSTHGDKVNSHSTIVFRRESLKKRYHYVNLDIDGRIMLKLILER